MYDQARALRDEADILNSLAAKLKSMQINAQKTLIIIERLRLEKLDLASKLDAKSRVENLNIYELKVKRSSGKGKTKIYSYWYASWRMNTKVKNVCLGSIKTMTHEEALRKAQKLKARSLGVDY